MTAKQIIIRVLIVLLIIVLSFIGIVYPFLMAYGDNPGIAVLLSFLLTAVLIFMFLRFFKTKVGLWGIIIPPLAVLTFLFVSAPSAKFLLKMSPTYISVILGMIAAFLLHRDNLKKFIVPAVLAIFPILMGIKGYELWIHKVEFGNWSGQVTEAKVVNFALPNEQGEIIDNEALKGKVVMLDFWFIGCGPCYTKFPEVQRLYDKYKDDDQVELYAINRYMKGNKEGEAFSDLKEEYSFPVLAGKQSDMDAFGVYVYPTVVLLNQSGEVVFMGNIDGIEQEIEKLRAVL